MSSSQNVFDPGSVREAATVAENEPTRFPATERSVYIKDMITRFERYQVERRTTEEIKTLMPEFVTAYPKLFDMISKSGYDKSQIRTMIAMLERMGSGDLSQHQASVIVGQKLANSYVNPVVNRRRN